MHGVLGKVRDPDLRAGTEKTQCLQLGQGRSELKLAVTKQPLVEMGLSRSLTCTLTDSLHSVQHAHHISVSANCTEF